LNRFYQIFTQTNKPLSDNGMTNVIELEQLSVTFGKRPILKSLNGALGGRAIGLLGPNGAGKTSLIHTLLGFHPPTSGTARIFGQDITTDAKQVRATVGYMPESDSFIAKCRASTLCV
jgi:ABC-2 type transport system ATP-binding protein